MGLMRLDTQTLAPDLAGEDEASCASVMSVPSGGSTQVRPVRSYRERGAA